MAELPHLDTERLYVADAGMETDLIFGHGLDLPQFASFPLLEDERGRAALRHYYKDFFRIARDHRAGLVLDTPTWRANRSWGEKLGYDRARLARVNTGWIEFVSGLRDEWPTGGPVVIDGLIGPRGDGYVPGQLMSSDEATEYHGEQVATFQAAGAEMVTVLTMNYAEEAIGVARAAAEHGIPAAVGLTVETDGRLATGQPLGEAIEQIDAETGGSPAYFLVNCAHPTHFEDSLKAGTAWRERIRGVRANASKMSHAELDEAEELDAGDPSELAGDYARLAACLPNLNVVGGCCGTDARHVAAACAQFSRA